MKMYRPPVFDDLVEDPRPAAPSRGHAGAEEKKVERLLPSDEDLISLAVIARKVGTHYGTVLRWANVGSLNRFTGRRVKLETLDGTHRRRSSMRAYHRMIERLNEHE
jgi:hypothetical protein